jgi:prepilin-type N-terminal cleavage/methylation domain-containing protein/prepilin-type processing-associated H-X9-DG protein
MSQVQRRGFTLVELLVVIAIIGVLISLLLPAIQAAREAARRSSCSQNISQLLIALQNYEGAKGGLPPGVTNPTGPIRNEPIGQHYSWLVYLLPYMDDANTFRHIDLEAGVYAKPNRAVRDISRQVFVCPSDVATTTDGKTSYAGCHHDSEAPIDSDNNGVLFLNSKVRFKDITDGVAFTIFIGEKVIEEKDLGWMSGTRATLRNAGQLPPVAAGWTGGFGASTGDDSTSEENTGESAESTQPPAEPATPAPSETQLPKRPKIDPLYYVGPFSSMHSGSIVNYGFGDGSVRALGSIDPKVYAHLANRGDGELLKSDEF